MFKKNIKPISVVLFLIIVISSSTLYGYKAFVSNSKIFNSVEDMKSTELNIGDKVSTNGYYSKGDNGEATYEIVSYDIFYEELPEDLKAVAYRNDKWGLGNPYWSKTPVDEYGNHTLENGLVAKLILEDENTPEQWGARGDGISDNTEPFIHLFAHTKSGYIKFNENATYLMKSRPLNREGIKTGDSRYNLNEYIWLLCGYFTAGAGHGKPVMANIDGVVLDGNGATIKIADDDFSVGTNDFGVFEFGKSIKNLEIKNFVFDGNGLSQVGEDTRTTNHTLVYIPGGYKGDNPGSSENSLSDFGVDNTIFKDLKNEFSDVKIHNNTFKNNGTGVDTSDGGGDFILLINPEVSNNVEISNNYFEDWGRWVFSVDLGGEGETFENYKFNNNKCVQTDNNKLENGQYRGLGWIDFEARKAWKNLEVKYNYVEGLNGFAINGNGKVSENVTISGNAIIRPDRPYKSAYPYMFEFYGVEMKDLIFEDNNITASGGSKFGYTLNNVTIRNNKLTNPIQLLGLYGDIIIDNNIREDKGALIQLLGLEIPTYINEEEKKCNFEFTNNVGGIEGARGQQAMFFDPSNPGKYKYIKLKIDGNDSKIFNIVAWDAKNFTFNPSQVDKSTEAFSVRGAIFTEPTYTTPVNNPALGGGIYDKGSIITNNLDECVRRESAAFYKDMDFTGYTILKSVKKGYLPMNGHFLLANGDIKFNGSNKVKKNDHIYTDSELYIACNEGALGDELTHIEGSILCGDVEMLHITNLAEIEASK